MGRAAKVWHNWVAPAMHCHAVAQCPDFACPFQNIDLLAVDDRQLVLASRHLYVDSQRQFLQHQLVLPLAWVFVDVLEIYLIQAPAYDSALCILEHSDRVAVSGCFRETYSQIQNQWGKAGHTACVAIMVW